jgi:1-deoxy-D-xylulose-5-phosphate reductoisomerase
MQNITILGATGSIGGSTLNILARHPDKYKLFAVSAHTDVQALLAICREWQPPFAVMVEERAAEELAALVQQAGLATQVLAGEAGLVSIAAHPDCHTVVAAVVGAAGLLPTLAAARAGKRLCLANKEALIIGGELLMRAVEEGGATLIPVDSEHNALFQAMPPGYRTGFTPPGVERLILTASGGPFRELSLEQLHQVTPAQAIAHPNWSMGPKVSVDSATMMNKGLEVIEAFWLFKMPASRIDVVIHPQSIIHSLVEYADGSQLAQLGVPDMRTPIACALSWPERIQSGVAKLDLAALGQLTFYPPDYQRFPCLGLAFEAINQGGAAPAILNAANEVAVAAFLKGQIPFSKIPQLIEAALNNLSATASITTVDDLLTIDHQTRQQVGQQLGARF